MVLKGETYLIKLQMHLQRKINRMSIAFQVYCEILYYISIIIIAKITKL